MLILSSRSNPELALFFIRMAVGSIALLHGSQKVFGLFGGPGMTGFASWLATFGIPGWVAYLGALGEFFGGVLILWGIATQLGAAIFALDMVAAIYLVHWKHGYFAQNNGYEYPLTIIILCLALIVGGPGNYAFWKQ